MRRKRQTPHAYLTPTSSSEEAAFWKRREKILSIGPAKSFYFLDPVLVRDLFDQTGEQLRLKERESHRGSKFSLGGGLSFRGTSAKADREASESITDKYQSVESLARMYNEVEARLVKQELVTFGIEVFEYDRFSGVFDAWIESPELAGRNDDEAITKTANHVVLYENKVAMERLVELAKVTGYVAIQERFEVYRLDGDSVTLRLSHKLNDYFAKIPTSSGDKPVISFYMLVPCNAHGITNLGQTYFRVGQKILLTVFGRVVGMDVEERAMIINPIAVY